MKKKKRILIAILDWGLGHATRCIPIIEALLQQEADLILASSGSALELLKREFPNCTFIKLPAYNIRYYSFGMVGSMLLQGPKIISTIIQEYWQLQKIIRDQKIDLVISDSRFGCFTKQVPCIFITHQLHIQMPAYLKQLQRVVNFFNHWIIKKYHSCWVPDFADTTKNLSGILAHPAPFPIQYIGPLSRMKPLVRPIRYDIIAILSGPEPQRSMLEQLLLMELAKLDKKILLVRGLPKGSALETPNKHIRIVPFLTAQALNEAIAESAFVICRSGYSSIMDLVILRKPALLIPTPEQTEQEYLARYLKSKGQFLVQAQGALDLKEIPLNLEGYPEFTALDSKNNTIAWLKLLEELD